jgi:hypothetical protein
MDGSERSKEGRYIKESRERTGTDARHVLIGGQRRKKKALL